MRSIVVFVAAAIVGCGGNNATSVSASTSASSANQVGPTLKAGDMAPSFELQGSDGKTHKLSDHVGREAVVIAWFPKAFTGG
jgi:thioredoxin-dependent peroxiredoxin